MLQDDMKRGGFRSLFTVHRSPHLAFTLAEVLITLGIIGVVAAFTIPTLMNNIQDAQYKTAYKKAFSTAQQALNSMNKDYLWDETPYAQNNQVNKNNFITFMNQFIVTKKCISSDNDQCWDINGEKFGTNQPVNTAACFIDASGYAWSQAWFGGREMLIDTNGFKKPNQYGKDRFFLYLLDETKSTTAGLPITIGPFADNLNWGVCEPTNKCYAEDNYFGTSWLYN